MTNKKLYKDSQNKMISGVCAGIAKYFGIDVTIVRLAAVILSLLTAVLTGIIAYIICALVIPADPTVVDAE